MKGQKKRYRSLRPYFLVTETIDFSIETSELGSSVEYISQGPSFKPDGHTKNFELDYYATPESDATEI